MDPSLSGLTDILTLNARLFVNCLHDVTEQQLRAQPAPDVNTIGLLACHIIDARRYLLKLIDVDVPDPFGGRLERVQKVSDMTWYPTTGDLTTWWRDLAAKLEARLDALTPDDLARPVDMPFPTDDQSVRGAIAFLTQHEAYHIGQMAYVRRCVGLAAMTYR